MNVARKVSALIVEDEQIVALDIRRRLNKLGYEVIGMVPSAERAFSVLEKHMPDIVLMDINIQGDTDGIDLAQQIGLRSAVPVIYLTAYSEETTLKRAKATKPYGYLLKPFSERDLDVAIQVALERFNADQLTRRQEEHLRLALEAAQMGTWEYDQHSQTVKFGERSRELVGEFTSWRALKDKIVSDDRRRVWRALSKLKREGEHFQSVEFRMIDSQQRMHWLKVHGKAYNGLDGQRKKLAGLIEDITERYNIERQLNEAATVFQCASEGIAILDEHFSVNSINAALENISGYSQLRLRGRPLPFLTAASLGSRQFEALRENVTSRQAWHGETKTQHRNGVLIHLLVNVAPIPNKTASNSKYVVVVSDITVLRETQEKLTHIAFFDTLTDLPNRALLMDRFQQSLVKAEREGGMLAVLFLDLDNFKRINDTMGHQAGDAMLRGIARRLASRLRKSDTISRLGGDEFVVILSEIQQRQDAIAIAEGLLEVLSHPLMLINSEIIPSGSIGVSFFPDDSRSAEDLIRMADTAMYTAKTGGSNHIACYVRDMTQRSLQYMLRERELRAALQDDQFMLYFQPIFGAESGTLQGAEALLRWQHPDQGVLGADEVIPFAESSYLIVEIGQHVIDKACQQLRQWINEGLKVVPIAVNISVKQFMHDNIPDFVSKCCARYQIPHHLLKIEVTETCLQQEEAVIRELHALQELGFEISLDDFGTGYSCLMSLKQLPIAYIKVDRSFVAGIPHNPDDCAIVAAIVAMSQQLDMGVIAEGVETEAQHQILGAMGCTYIQGYFLSRPIDAPQFTQHFLRF